MSVPKVEIFNEDCIRGMAERLPDKSVHLTVTSIPFGELFTYSGKLEDVGNNGSTIDIRAGRFALNMRFVVEQLFRVTADGCNVCIHIQQLLAYKNQHGFKGRRDFRGAMIDVFSAGGFTFAGEFAIQKNPQAMAQRLNLHSLMFISGKRNANDLAPCPNDYVLIFHKPGECLNPVQAIPDAKHNADGWLSTEEWIRDAHGIWTDILEIDVLDGSRMVKEDAQEKHVCRCSWRSTVPTDVPAGAPINDAADDPEEHHRRTVAAAEKMIVSLSIEVANLKGSLKSKRKQLDSAIEHLCDLQDEGPEHLPLLDGVNKPAGGQTVNDTKADETANGDASTASSDAAAASAAESDPSQASWRAVTVEQLGLDTGAVKILKTENAIHTLGELADFANANHGNLAKLKKVGKVKAEHITNVVEAWWNSHPDMAPEPTPSPAPVAASA